MPHARQGRRPDPPDARRHDLDRRGHHRTAPHRAGAGQGPRRCRGRQPREERVPRQHQPRDPHAAQRPGRPRAAGAPARSRRRPPGAVPRADRRERRDPVGDHLRRARPVEDRGRQARCGTRRLRPARAARVAAPVYGTLADARGLAFTLAVAADVPGWVWGDPVRVRPVLGNYLNNALKFTERGSVALAVHRSPAGAVRFEVRDTGPGITPDVRERLFRPFTQADQSTTRRFGGSGLGLSICHELAGLMGGSVGVDSEPGCGSCFWAELPLPATEPPARDSGFGSLGPSPLAGARVLMVEDNAVNMTIAVAMLEQWGVQVSQAGDGAQALVAVEQAERSGQPLDAVLMDVQMPVMSGYEATRALRARPGTRRLPIIALTAAALTSEREQALAAGMDGFLTKPIDMQKLHDALVAALARAA
ncbi:response regulator [Piscinibacter aquaticus]|uniref:Virulence sensor protein BvgS n=1 Tax=Piscinibacter aquaticus TaxID=392597 RepID=A0A5C6U2H0_9BURK|nr:response regulator [Piscinibacter aquaticus]